MALRNPSLFLYGFQVTALNASLDFRAVLAETPRLATLRFGYYSLSSLCTEIKRAMQAVDPTRTYTVTANRNVGGGTQNRVTITTSGVFLELLFASGPRASSTVAPLIGFPSTDQTGSTTYTGNASSGIVLVPNMVGYNYLSPSFYQRNFGSVNVSSSGVKESITFAIQFFWQVRFKYIPELTWSTQWTALMNWMIQQRLIEFTPDITDPDTFFEGTLETTEMDGKGLAFRASEQLVDFPFNYDTGLMVFRKSPPSVASETPAPPPVILANSLRYVDTTGPLIAALAVNQTIIFGTLDFDEFDPGDYNPLTGEFTVSDTDHYRIIATVKSQDGFANGSQPKLLNVMKNGVFHTTLDIEAIPSGGFALKGMDTLFLNAGDIIKIAISNTQNLAFNLSTLSGDNYLIIEKVE